MASRLFFSTIQRPARSVLSAQHVAKHTPNSFAVGVTFEPITTKHKSIIESRQKAEWSRFLISKNIPDRYAPYFRQLLPQMATRISSFDASTGLVFLRGGNYFNLARLNLSAHLPIVAPTLDKLQVYITTLLCTLYMPDAVDLIEELLEWDDNIWEEFDRPSSTLLLCHFQSMKILLERYKELKIEYPSGIGNVKATGLYLQEKTGQVDNWRLCHQTTEFPFKDMISPDVPVAQASQNGVKVGEKRMSDL